MAARQQVGAGEAGDAGTHHRDTPPARIRAVRHSSAAPGARSRYATKLGRNFYSSSHGLAGLSAKIKLPLWKKDYYIVARFTNEYFGRLSFKDQAFKLREDAILDAATRTLAAKGFDLMTMDDVAAEVGISKPSLYKHFKSKEDLVGEVMVRLVDGALSNSRRSRPA